MTVTFKPSKANGTVYAPPSKSIAHRALICGALTEESTINNIDFSDDINATLDCLKKLGTSVKINGNSVTLGGLSLTKIKDNTELFCGESASTLRFLIPLCMACGKRINFKGEKGLFSRPLETYENIAKQNNIEFIKTENSLTVCGNLKSSNYTLSGNISSQFISGFLFLLPFLKSGTKISVNDGIQSAPYVNLTIDVLSAFGVKISRTGDAFTLCENSKYTSAKYTVEGDYSSAAFLDAFNCVGGNVTVLGLNRESRQGDKVYKEIFQNLQNGEKNFDLSNAIDLAPILFAVSAVFGGAVFSGTGRLIYKESDRAKAMCEELQKFGILSEIGENSVTVKSGELSKPETAVFCHNDHRIAMALSVLLSVTGGCLKGAQCVSKSYPDFFKVISQLGIDIEII